MNTEVDIVRKEISNIKNSEVNIDNNMKQFFGINPQLMFRGNTAMILFDVIERSECKSKLVIYLMKNWIFTNGRT
jgi:hypothetical protein